MSSLQVEAIIEGQTLVPRAFRWRGQRHQVLDLGRSWFEEQRRHWLVRTPNQKVFELIHHLEEGRWEMGRTPTDFQPRRPVA